MSFEEEIVGTARSLVVRIANDHVVSWANFAE